MVLGRVRCGPRPPLSPRYSGYGLGRPRRWAKEREYRSGSHWPPWCDYPVGVYLSHIASLQVDQRLSPPPRTPPGGATTAGSASASDGCLALMYLLRWLKVNY